MNEAKALRLNDPKCGDMWIFTSNYGVTGSLGSTTARATTMRIASDAAKAVKATGTKRGATLPPILSRWPKSRKLSAQVHICSATGKRARGSRSTICRHEEVPECSFFCAMAEEEMAL